VRRGRKRSGSERETTIIIRINKRMGRRRTDINGINVARQLAYRASKYLKNLINNLEGWGRGWWWWWWWWWW
jgi:hypothetical protein